MDESVLRTDLQKSKEQIWVMSLREDSYLSITQIKYTKCFLQISETPVSEILSSLCSAATSMNLERLKILLSCSLNKEEFGREYMIWS